MSREPRQPQQSAEQITKRSRSNFYFAFLFLPKAKRDALHSIYAFCRRSDDIADQALPADERRVQLAEWRAKVDACYSGQTSDPALQSLALHVEQFGIPKSYLDDLMAGVEMDLDRDRYETFEDLYRYCYRVASVVGLICIEIFGYEDPRAKKFAEYLGIALQLTNIIRDVGSDAEQGRIYLPLQDVREFGVSEGDILGRRYGPDFVRLAEFQAARAESFYQRAFASLPASDRKRLLPAEIMAAIYHRLLSRIRRGNYDVFSEKVSVPDWLKLVDASRLWLSSLFR